MARAFVSFLESGLTFVSTVKPDSRKDTDVVRQAVSRYDCHLLNHSLDAIYITEEANPC
jgi:hypothetical protein